MAITLGPQIQLRGDIGAEVGLGSSSNVNLDNSLIRGLIGKAAGAQNAMSEYYGASNAASFVGYYSRQVNAISALTQFTSGNPVNLTGAGVQPGDLVVMYAASGGSLRSNTSFGGMTLNYPIGASSLSSPGRWLAWGIWQSGDSNPYFNDPSTSTTGNGVYLIAGIWRNTNTTLLNSLEASNTRFMPDPPSNSSVAGSKVIIACGGLDDDALNMTAQSGYTLVDSGNSNAFGAIASTGMSYKIVSTDVTENPAAFGGGGDDTWKAHTLRF